MREHEATNCNNRQEHDDEGAANPGDRVNFFVFGRFLVGHARSVAGTPPGRHAQRQQEVQHRLVGARQEPGTDQEADQRVAQQHHHLAVRAARGQGLDRRAQALEGQHDHADPQEIADQAELGEAQHEGVVRGQMVVIGEVAVARAPDRTPFQQLQSDRPGLDALAGRLLLRREAAPAHRAGAQEGHAGQAAENRGAGGAQPVAHDEEQQRGHTQQRAARLAQHDGVEHDRAGRDDQQGVAQPGPLAPQHEQQRQAHHQHLGEVVRIAQEALAAHAPQIPAGLVQRGDLGGG